METRQIHVRDLSTVTGIQQFEHEVQSIYFLGLEDFAGTIYLSMESDEYSNEAVPLTSNTFIIGQPMTKFNTTYTCQIYGVLNDGEKIQLSKRFRLIVDKSNTIQGESSEYPIDPNFKNSIIEFVTEQKSELNAYTDDKQSEIEATGDAVIASIPSDYTALEQATYNAYPTESESGNPIYFDDGAGDIPVKELIVNLEPKQEGEGDPSPTNVRQISGYDGVNVTFNEEIYSITFPSSVGTVYGGTLNVTTGELTVTHGIVTDFSALASNGTSSTGAYRYRLNVADVASSNTTGAMSNMLKYRANFNANAGEFYNATGVFNIFLADSTVESAITTLTGCQIVYPLATPTTVQLTPIEVTTLLGSNAITSDGNINLTYRADISKVIEKLTNAIVSLGGNI